MENDCNGQKKRPTVLNIMPCFLFGIHKNFVNSLLLKLVVFLDYQQIYKEDQSLGFGH